MCGRYRLSPVILNKDSYDVWLDPGMMDIAAVSKLLNPALG